jgi:hypothetical protein
LPAIKQESNMTANKDQSSSAAQRTPVRSRSSAYTTLQQQGQLAHTRPLFSSGSSPRHPNPHISNDFSADDSLEDELPPPNFRRQNIATRTLNTITARGRHAPISSADPSRVIPTMDNMPPYINQEAHQLKSLMTSTQNIPYAQDNTRRRIPEQDPENYEIKRLRVEDRLSWSAIAQHLNSERVKQGRQPTHTDASVYSRFVRNGPRIAQMQGETLNPKEWMHLKDEKKRLAPKALRAKWTSQDEVFLVQAYADAQASFWGMVSEFLEERSGKKVSAEECAGRFAKI